MTKNQITKLKIGQRIYFKKPSAKGLTSWLIEGIYPDCVFVIGEIKKQDGSAYAARRIVTVKCLENDWSVWQSL